MTKKIKELDKKFGSNQVLRFKRPTIDPETLDGFLVDSSDEYIILHVLDPGIFLDGYSVIRKVDIRSFQPAGDPGHLDFINKALKIRKQRPKPLPEVKLCSMKEIFSTASRIYPLIVIHREKIDNEVCYIGRINKLTEKTVTLEEIDPAAKWSRIKRYNFSDITKIDFGGAYERALWEVARYESKRRK